MVVEKNQILVDLLLKHGMVKTGSFVLKCGAASNIYVDLRQITLKSEVYNLACEQLVDYIKKHIIVENADSDIAVVGVPYGVVPLAAVVAKESGLIYYPVRKEVKGYGCKPVEDDRFRFIIIEDVMSTGSSIIETIQKLPADKVTDVIVVVDRERGGLDNINKMYPNIRVRSILKISQIVKDHEN